MALVPSIAPPTLETRVEGITIKERYGAMADWDAEVMLPLLRRMQTERNPASDGRAPDGARWHGVEFQGILETAVAARTALVDYATSLSADAWVRTGTLRGTTHDLYGLLHALTQHDLQALQGVAEQMKLCVQFNKPKGPKS